MVNEDQPSPATLPFKVPEPPPPAPSRSSSKSTTLLKAPPAKNVPAPAAPNLGAKPVAGEPTVKLTIDGEAVEVRKGTNVLEAAKMLGRDICHFCYHPGLTIAASCRQCLVEIEKMPKLQPSCQQVVAEGMVVHTESPAVV